MVEGGRWGGGRLLASEANVRMINGFRCRKPTPSALTPFAGTRSSLFKTFPPFRVFLVGCGAQLAFCFPGERGLLVVLPCLSPAVHSVTANISREFEPLPLHPPLPPPPPRMTAQLSTLRSDLGHVFIVLIRVYRLTSP